MRARAWLVGVAAVVLIVLVTAAAAFGVTAGAVLDQSAAEGSCNSVVSTSQWLAETFTAGRSGALTDVVLRLVNPSATSGIHVSITDVSAGVPGSTTLAATDIPTGAVGGTEVSYDVAFPTPAQVTAGSMYAITLTRTTGSGQWDWGCSNGDDYAGGNAAYSNGGSWNALGWDYAFESYVLAAAPQGAEREGYCAAAGNTTPSGAAIAAGTFLDLVSGQPDSDLHYAGAQPARYIRGEGITCDPPPAGWTQHGLADWSGPNAGPGAGYPYFAPGT